MPLRYAALGADGKLSDEAVLDERICECCQTSAAVTAEGVIAAYRDRSDQKVRDIPFVRVQGGGWSAPADGALGPVAVISSTDVSRSSGFPRTARQGNTVRFAWTQYGKTPRVRMSPADASAFR